MSQPTPDGAAGRSAEGPVAAPGRRCAIAWLAAILPGAGAVVPGGFWSQFWPFPSVVFSAFLISWGAECAQFLVSRGMALAILAWLQALPEFAVEAVIAWSQQVHFMTANFTGSLRLLVGLGWPLIFSVASWGEWRRHRRLLRSIRLDEENCVEVLVLGLPIVYFLFIYYKATLTLVDAGVLLIVYILYLWILQKLPPRDAEHIEDLEAIPRSVMRLPHRPRVAAIVAFFIGGGAILCLAAEPFLHSMLKFAVTLGVSEYLFIQWVSPFLSEFPEKLSAMNWARQKGKAPMALLNMISANINQWTMLAAMIPVVYSFSLGHPAFVPFDDFQRKEILLTVAQSMLGMMLLLNMSFHIIEAGGIFFLWGLQFAVPHLHEEVTIVYFAWVAYELFVTAFVRRRVPALIAFRHLWARHGRRAPATRRAR
jgi:cation:H+ antiporter